MEKRTLLLECESGISGDMFVAALLDLGREENGLQDRLGKALESLQLPGFEIKVSRVKKASIDCCDFDVVVDKEHENHDHDMQYLFGYEDHHHDDHVESHHHHENHAGTDHHHTDDHVHHGEHEGRKYSEIKEIIERGALSPRTKTITLSIFQKLGEAEAKAHGTTLEEVHFHEVGSVDSIVDIVSAAFLLDALQVEKVYVPYVCEGHGTIRSAHGILPIPVPAVSRILETYTIPVKRVDVQGELVTPTGAAILASVCDLGAVPQVYRTLGMGIGAGKRQYERPSMLRIFQIDPVEQARDTIWKLECNVDDAPAEELGYCMERLLEAGARDVQFSSCMMKKNRLGTLITVICKKEQIATLEQILFKETTTIGIRRVEMERTILPREIQTIATSLGDLKVKVCTLPDGEVRYYPEYESMKELANTTGKSILEIRKLVEKEA